MKRLHLLFSMFKWNVIKFFKNSTSLDNL